MQSPLQMFSKELSPISYFAKEDSSYAFLITPNISQSYIIQGTDIAIPFCINISLCSGNKLHHISF